METTREFQQFLRGYIAALLWSSNDACPITGDMRDLDEYELSTAGADKCRADCLAFFTANRADIDAAAGAYDLSHTDGADTGYDFAGHDFALTRNHHGAGFWDGDLPEDLGNRLTAAAHAAGEVNPYIGDDGEVHF